MTCLAVMADVHGNMPALQAVLEDMQQYPVEGIIVAGDMVVGPRSVECIRLLRSLPGWMIQGNGEIGQVQYRRGLAPQAWRQNAQFAMLRWGQRQLDQETFDFIAALPEQRVIEVDGRLPIRVVHGSPRNPSELVFPFREPHVLDLALSQVAEPVLVLGHTHRPWQVRCGDRLALNPGAVCCPLNGFVGAQYALLTWQEDGWQVEHRAVPYDVDLVRADFVQSGLLEEGGALARAFLRSIETGRDVAIAFLNAAYALAAEAGLVDCPFVPDAAWEQAAATFAWDAF